MYIRELTGYKSNQYYQTAKDTFDDEKSSQTNPRIGKLIQFQKYMVDNGFKPLGAPGQAGTAFENPSYPWVFKLFSHDPAYLYFIKYAKQHQDNPNIPKFKGNIMKINQNTFVIRMEKLVRGSGPEFDKVISMLSNLSEIYDVHAMPDYHRLYLQQNYPGLYQAVYDLANRSKYFLDLHRGNIMQRENGELVLMDPIMA